MSGFVRSGLAGLIAFAVGTWLACGAGRESAARPGALAVVAPLSASQVAVDAPTVDPGSLPDPTPWPRMNPEQTLHRAWLLAEGPAHAPSDRRRLVTFTFDDGPFPETTPLVLEVLARYHVRATFFWIGRYLDGDDDRSVATRAVARQVATEGHWIGNHTHDHRALATLPPADVLAQVEDGAASIERVVGRRPVFFRPPFGSLDSYASNVLKQRGDELVLWNIEASDMLRKDPAVLAEDLRTQLAYAGGGIVLLHDIRQATVPVLETLLHWLSAHRYDPAHPERVGYDVVDLPAYLQATARSPQPFEARSALETARARAWQARHHARSVPAPLPLGSESPSAVDEASVGEAGEPRELRDLRLTQVGALSRR